MSPIKNNVKNAPDTEHKVEYVKRSILTLLNTGETKCERKAVKYSLVAIFIVLLALLTINFGISAIDAPFPLPHRKNHTSDSFRAMARQVHV